MFSVLYRSDPFLLLVRVSCMYVPSLHSVMSLVVFVPSACLSVSLCSYCTVHRPSLRSSYLLPDPFMCLYCTGSPGSLVVFVQLLYVSHVSSLPDPIHRMVTSRPNRRPTLRRFPTTPSPVPRVPLSTSRASGGGGVPRHLQDSPWDSVKGVTSYGGDRGPRGRVSGDQDGTGASTGDRQGVEGGNRGLLGRTGGVRY